MIRSFLLCSTLLLVTGCGQLPFAPDMPPAGVTEEVVIIGKFNDIDTVIITQQGFRVGGYYDLSTYDSVRVNFSAERLASTKPVDRIQVRIGPATTFSDSLAFPRRDFSILINPSRVSKARYAAVIFVARDSGVNLRLSHLRVVGWLQH